MSKKRYFTFEVTTHNENGAEYHHATEPNTEIDLKGRGPTVHDAILHYATVRKSRLNGTNENFSLDRVMIDIETLGLEPGCVPISIGACRFRPGEGVLDSFFYSEIDIDTATAAGLTVDEDTFEWWQRQDDDITPLNGDVSLSEALESLSVFIADADEIWANSPSFDCSILEAAYDAVGIVEPWEFYQQRDVRTVRSLPFAVDLDMDGREHHALDDARHQAREVAATLELIPNATV